MVNKLRFLFTWGFFYLTNNFSKIKALHCAANPGNDKNFELQLDKNISELLNE